MMNGRYSERVEDLFAFSRQFGLSDALWGVDYQRAAEYALAAEAFPDGGNEALDIGTGTQSILPFYLASRFGARMSVTDISPEAVSRQRKRFARFRGGLPQEPAFLHRDCACLPLDMGSMDYVTAVSVVEHIWHDSSASSEIGRVLRSGGRDVYRNKSSYTQRYDGRCPVFFERGYDRESLQSRIIGPSKLELADIRYIGEPGFSWRSAFLMLPFRNALKYGLGWANERLALSFQDIGEDPEKAQIAALTLRKP